MPFVARSSWGDLGSKLLGCYEQELHPAIERGLTRGWDRIMNIGCAEAYYAVASHGDFRTRDFMDRSITAELMRRFDAAHEIEVVREQSGDTCAIPLPSEMGCFEALLLVCGFRPERIQWLVLSTRATGLC